MRNLKRGRSIEKKRKGRDRKKNPFLVGFQNQNTKTHKGGPGCPSINQSKRNHDITSTQQKNKKEIKFISLLPSSPFFSLTRYTHQPSQKIKGSTKKIGG
jgi:hypothetical protein